MIPSVCSVCLRCDLRTQRIEDKVLQLHEKLTDKLVGDVGVSLCYICRSQLQTCCRYYSLSQESDRLLRGLMDKGIEFTQENIQMRNLKTTKKLLNIVKHSTLNSP